MPVGGRQADTQTPRRCRLRAHDGLLGFHQLTERLAALLEEGSPGLGQADAAGGSGKESRPQSLLQTKNRAADRRGVTPASWAAAVKLPASAARQNNSMLPNCKSSKWRFITGTG